MRRLHSAIWAVLLAGSVSIAACGGDDSKGSSDSAGAAGTSAAEGGVGGHAGSVDSGGGGTQGPAGSAGAGGTLDASSGGSDARQDAKFDAEDGDGSHADTSVGVDAGASADAAGNAEASANDVKVDAADASTGLGADARLDVNATDGGPADASLDVAVSPGADATGADALASDAGVDAPADGAASTDSAASSDALSSSDARADGGSACLACETVAHQDPTTLESNPSCPDSHTAGLAFAGVTVGGPRAGTSRASLFLEVLDCFHRTHCAKPDSTGAVPDTDCFCGTGIDPNACFASTYAAATGACKELVAAAAESTAIGDINNRYFDPTYVIGAVTTVIETCDLFSCAAECL